MAKHKQTARKSTSGQTFRKQLATKANIAKRQKELDDIKKAEARKAKAIKAAKNKSKSNSGSGSGSNSQSQPSGTPNVSSDNDSDSNNNQASDNNASNNQSSDNNSSESSSDDDSGNNGNNNNGSADEDESESDDDNDASAGNATSATGATSTTQTVKRGSDLVGDDPAHPDRGTGKNRMVWIKGRYVYANKGIGHARGATANRAGAAGRIEGKGNFGALNAKQRHALQQKARGVPLDGNLVIAPVKRSHWNQFITIDNRKLLRTYGFMEIHDIRYKVVFENQIGVTELLISNNSLDVNIPQTWLSPAYLSDDEWGTINDEIGEHRNYAPKCCVNDCNNLSLARCTCNNSECGLSICYSHYIGIRYELPPSDSQNRFTDDDFKNRELLLCTDNKLSTQLVMKRMVDATLMLSISCDTAKSLVSQFIQDHQNSMIHYFGYQPLERLIGIHINVISMERLINDLEVQFENAAACNLNRIVIHC